MGPISIFSIIAVLTILSGNNAETEFPMCATNTSQAFLDVIIMIDTSANMGNANLRKATNLIALGLSKFPIGNQYDIMAGQRNTRISVITYNDMATINANYTQINTINDLTVILNNVQVTNTQTANIYDAFLKAFYMDTNCTDPYNCSISYYYRRPTAFLLFAASSNTPNVTALTALAQESDFFDDGTFITVNFNPDDGMLQSLLLGFTYDQVAQVSMYNYSSSLATVGNDIVWALTQANCYCGDLWGVQNVRYDNATNSYQRSRECFILDIWEGQYPSDTLDMCCWPGLRRIPGFDLSQEKTSFLQSIYGSQYVPFYIGLHKNNQNQWAWWDYNRTEFALSGYTTWAPNDPQNQSCAIFDADANGNYVWKSFSCNTETSGESQVLCQKLACDTTSLTCCADCNPDVVTCNFWAANKKQKPRKETTKKFDVKKWRKEQKAKYFKHVLRF